MSYTDLNYHVVFATRERRAMLTAEICPRLWDYLRVTTENLGGTLMTAGGVVDHVHLALRIPATRDVVGLVRDIKANSSRWLRQLDGMNEFHWQDGYAAFTVSRSVLPKVIQYIDGQESHHQAQPFMAEFEELLQRHDVDFDRAYLGS